MKSGWLFTFATQNLTVNINQNKEMQIADSVLLNIKFYLLGNLEMFAVFICAMFKNW